MLVQQLDTFFRTHLTTERRSVCNTLTNIAFAPLQHLVGQQRYQSLNGKVTALPPPPFQTNYSIVNLVVWAMAFILAIPGTPIGVVTRSLSFFSPDVYFALSAVLYDKLPMAEKPNLANKISPAVYEAIVQQERDEQKAEQTHSRLDDQLHSAIVFFFALERELPPPTADGSLPPAAKEGIEAWMKAESSRSWYCYPFAFASKLTPEQRTLANPARLQRFDQLLQSCCAGLDALGITIHKNEETLMEAARRQAIVKIALVFQKNSRFFNELYKMIRATGVTNEAVTEWLTAQKRRRIILIHSLQCKRQWTTCEASTKNRKNSLN